MRAYMDAMERGDVPAVVAMLTEDATWSMPPIPSWYDRPAAIAVFLREQALAEPWRHAATRANGQLAVGCYSLGADGTRYLPAVLDVLQLRGDRIASVTGFVTPEVFPSFGLPDFLPLAG